jgi:hypothetical protein
MPQPLELARSSGGVLLVCCQTQTLLHNGPDGVVLEVEHVLRIPSQQSHPAHGSEGPRGQTRPQGAASIWGSPDSESREM